MKRKNILVTAMCVMTLLVMTLLTACSTEEPDTVANDEGKQTEFTQAQANLDENLKADEIDKDQCKGEDYGLILSSLSNEFWQTEREGAEAAAKDYGQSGCSSNG